LRTDPIRDEEQVVSVARAKRWVERDIGRPIGRGHSIIEEDAEHPIAESG
jgi:hypothetical protein